MADTLAGCGILKIRTAGPGQKGAKAVRAAFICAAQPPDCEKAPRPKSKASCTSPVPIMFTKEQELVDLALEDEDWDDGAVGRLVKLIGLQVGGGQSYVVKLAKRVTKKTPTLVNSPEFVAALGTLKPKHAWKILTTLKDEPRTQFATACCSWVDNGDWQLASAG